MAKGMALGQRSANDYAKKLVGVVEVTVGEKKAKFELVKEDGKEQKTFLGGKTTLVVPLEDLPAFPKLTPAYSGKQLRIRMTTEGDEVEALTPVTGHYTAKLIGLGPSPEKDGDPTPVERVFGEGTPKESRHLEFFAVYKITRGAFKGVQMPGYYLHYKFEKDEDGTTRFAGNFENKKATRLFQLRDWGNVHDLWEEAIEWDDVTILPVLLERALDADKEVELTVKDGYIKDVLPAQDEEPFADPEETPKAKRSVKELKAELGYKEVDQPDVNGTNKSSEYLSDDELDVIAPPPAKTAKKAAKKVAVEEVDEDL